MTAALVLLAVTSSEVLRYAAAFFFVIIALAILIALLRLTKTLGRVDALLTSVDTEVPPLMQKAGTALDGVNANLTNVDDITKDVAHITDRIDGVANTIEGAVAKPARKAAAFGAGFQTAMSSFMRRERGAEAAGEAESSSPSTAGFTSGGYSADEPAAWGASGGATYPPANEQVPWSPPASAGSPPDAGASDAGASWPPPAGPANPGQPGATP